MRALDETIDELYQLPLNEFTRARNALAKTLSGSEAARIRGLAKPTVVPWAVNQLYWTARPVYDRLLKSGQALRAEQIRALKGRGRDIRGTTEEHRAALSAAVHKAGELAAALGSHLSADVLARMLEAISLAGTQPEHPGRFNAIVEPAGFEALSGVVGVGTIRHAASTEPAGAARTEERPRADKGARAAADRRKQIEEEQRRAREEKKRAAADAALRRKHEAAVKAAERTVERARAIESRAASALERARKSVQQAESALASARARLLQR